MREYDPSLDNLKPEVPEEELTVSGKMGCYVVKIWFSPPRIALEYHGQEPNDRHAELADLDTEHSDLISRAIRIGVETVSQTNAIKPHFG